jgi:murein L,D-transpeptidase YcbB/YkuD
MLRTTSLAACIGTAAALTMLAAPPIGAQTAAEPGAPAPNAASAAGAVQSASEAPPPQAAAPAPEAATAAPPPAPEAATATPPPPPPEAAAATPPPPPVDPLLVQVRERLSSPIRGAVADDRDAVKGFYAKQDKLIWVSAEGFTPRAQHVMAEIAKADDWGLLASDFDLPKLAAMAAPLPALADAEIKLSLAALKYARFARGGRLEPLRVSRNFDQKPTIVEPADVMVALATSDAPGDYLSGLHPKHQQFHLLRGHLLKARAAAAKPARTEDEAEDVRLPKGPLLKPGVDHPHVALLRKRLKIAAAAGAENLFDSDLQDAVVAFQKTSGQRPDGVVGSATRAALNGGETSQPAFGSDEQRIIVNMERWRWMPEHMGEFHVWDNIPEFQMRIVKRGRVVHQAKIIVGRPETQSTLFSASMRYVIFGPEWGVPDSIKIKELLPYLRPSYEPSFFGFGGETISDTRILEKHNLRVSVNGQPVDASRVDWSQVDIRKFNFIQPSGPTNVLGAVKFRFPNKHDIYMHDTPQRELFAKSVRTFSHGCIRVQDPGRLAEVLLEEDKGWSGAQVRRLMAAGGNENVTLGKEIPVHITYFTAMVEGDGQLRSYGDVYGHDRRVALALSGRPLPLEPSSVASSESFRPERKEPRRSKYYTPPPGNDFFSGLFGN